MAADEETCHGNANFAIICSFISKFGEEFGLANSIPSLQRMLEDTENVDDELKEIHIKLLRKARKWFNKEKWERALVKFCHEYSSVDAWEIERFGYKKAKLSVKLELLKRLLELQFDCNAKFKGEVNKQDSISLRVLPIGRDLNGHMYWYQLDKECNLRLYMQEVEEEGSWKLMCSTKEDLETLLLNLGAKIESKEVKGELEEHKSEVKSEAELKSETTDEKNECKALESNSIESVLIKQEIDENRGACHSNDQECSVAKQDDAEHENVHSTSSPPIVASDLSGNKIPLKDCIINLECDNINVKDTDDQSYVIKPVTTDTNESKSNNDSIVIKKENLADELPDKVHLIISEGNLDKSEKEVSRSIDSNEGKLLENSVSLPTEHSEALDRPCESKKGDSVVLTKCANAKSSDNEPKKLMQEVPVEECLPSLVKSGNLENIVEKHLPEKLPYLENVSIKETHSTKVNSALATSLLSENVNTLLDHRNVNIDKKKQGDLLLYKSPPVIRNISLCDEVPMDLSTTGRSRESKNESFILSRPEYEIPGNYKSESFITKIERQLTKMCEDTESIKYRKNDKILFSSKHHKQRKSESFKKLHTKSVDQLHLNKINMEKQNLSNQTSVSVIVGEKCLTKESTEQPRQSVICEIKNSKLISNENNQVSSDSSNKLTSSSLANNHCTSSVSPTSSLQTTEKGLDQLDKGSVIQTVGYVSPSEKPPLLSPKADIYNNIVSERKNLGFRKCLLNEFKADKCSAKVISTSSSILIKDKSEDAKLLEKKMHVVSKSLSKEGECEESNLVNKCENAEPVDKKDNSEELKPVNDTYDKCEIIKSLSKAGESKDVKLVEENDLCEGTKTSYKNEKSEDVMPLNKEIKCKESESLNEMGKCETQTFEKESKNEEVKPSSKLDHYDKVKPPSTKEKCNLLEPFCGDQCEEVEQISKEDNSDVNIVLNEKDKCKRLNNLKDNCEDKNEDTPAVSCKTISEKVLEPSLETQKKFHASNVYSDKTLVKEADLLNDVELQQGEKTVESCNSSKVVVGNKTSSKKTQDITSDYETNPEKNACKLDVNETEDQGNQNICTIEENAVASVENNEESEKKSSSVEDVEQCVEISITDQIDKLNKNACSDVKRTMVLDDKNATSKEKELCKSDISNSQTNNISSENDVVGQQVSEINCQDKTNGDVSDKNIDETKFKEISEIENNVKELNKNTDLMKNGDLLEKDHEVNGTNKKQEDIASSVMQEIVNHKENNELALKETEHEERSQVRSKLRRSSRTSRGYREPHKNEVESSELEKSKAQRNEQKTNEVNEKDPKSQKCVHTDTGDLKTGTNKIISEEIICIDLDLDVKDDKCDKKICEIRNVKKGFNNGNKRRKSGTKFSKSSSRRNRNLRKSVRNVPKLDIPSENISTTVEDKSVSDLEATSSGPVPPVKISLEKLDKMKINFTPLTKDLGITCVNASQLCGMCISNVCFETKTKFTVDVKVVNNKHFKDKVKGSFSKSLSKVITGESAVCGDTEESFNVGRIRTRRRLKRECSATVLPPPRVSPVKSKAAPSCQSKAAVSSQSKPQAKGKAASPQVINSPVTTPRKRIRGKRAPLSKTPLPDSILEIIGNSEEKNISKNDKLKKSSDKKSNEVILLSDFPQTENSENESTPVKRSRRIQEQNQKKISQLAVEMEQEQRRLEKLAKQNAAVAKNKQKEAIEKTQKLPPPQPQQQPSRPTKRASRGETKQPEPVIIDLKNSPRKTRNRSRNLTKMTLMYEDDSKDLEYETSRDTVKSRRRRNGRRGRKKKYKPWDLSSESSSPSEDITEEEEEEEQEELLVFNTNEDEFACEEIDENAEPVIIRRARTARKAKSASEGESEAENEVAPDDKPCASCGKYDEPEWILLCDKCDSGYHTRCLAPPLMVIPDGDWYCPPCEHAFLVENLLVELHKLEQMLKQREREELRKQRLAYVGISLDNVLKPEKKEKHENESYEEEDDSDETSEDDRIYSKRSSRTRRVVNYQFKEFDELIQSAIEEEMLEFRLPGKIEAASAPTAAADSNEDSEADVVAPSRRKKAHRLNDLDFTDVEDSGEEYKGSSLSETEVSQSPQSDGSNSQHSGSSASWRGTRKTRSSGQKKRHKKRKSKNSGDSDYMDGESFRQTTRRAAQKRISYRELSSDEEWGDDKPTSKKWTKKRKPSNTSSESSDGSFRKRRSKKKARFVEKWKKSESDMESEPRKTKSNVQKWRGSESESEPKETRKKTRVQRWKDSESGSDSGSRKVKKTRTVQRWEGSESETESDSKKSSSSDSETSGTSVQSTEKWKIKKSSEGNGIKININRKLLDSDSDSTSGQARHKKKNVSRIVDSEDSEESEDDDDDDDASKKVSDEESTSESNAGQKGYKDDKNGNIKNVPSNSVKDMKSGPQITVTAAENVPETVADQGPPKAALHRVGIRLKEKASPSMQKVVKCVKPLSRSLIKIDSEHKNFDSSISETFSNDSQSLQGLPTEHGEPMCESDSEPDPKLNRFANDQYICKTEIFEKDSVYRPAKEDQSFNYNTAEEKSYQIPYTGLSSLQDYPSRPSPLKPSMVETYSNSTSPSKLTPLDSYSEAGSPKGFISLDSCSSFRKSGSFVSSDPEAKSRPLLTSDNYQGEIRFPPEQYPPYERPSHLSPAPCPSSPAAFPQSPSARENASPPRMYSQYPEPYAGQRSPEYYHGQQYYGRDEGVSRQNFVSNYSSENVSPYPYNTNSSQQPNGGFMIDTLLRSRNPDGEEDELTGVTDIVSYITQE